MTRSVGDRQKTAQRLLRSSAENWRASLDPAARHVEVGCTHAGLISDPSALGVIGEELRTLHREPAYPPAQAA